MITIPSPSKGGLKRGAKERKKRSMSLGGGGVGLGKIGEISGIYQFKVKSVKRTVKDETVS